MGESGLPLSSMDDCDVWASKAPLRNRIRKPGPAVSIDIMSPYVEHSSDY